MSKLSDLFIKMATLQFLIVQVCVLGWDNEHPTSQ